MSMSTLPLEGIRVIDLTRFMSGPLCAMYLGDLGADVIKVEHPREGDGTRRWGAGAHPADNPYYLSINRNKRSIGLDLKSEAGRAVLEKLLAAGDVLLVNAMPDFLEELGLGRARLQQLNPRLVLGQITGYGERGPDYQRGAFDFTIQAESGLMSLNGEPQGAPMKVGAPLMDVVAGLHACIAVLSGLLARAGGAPAPRVSTSMIEAALACMPNIVSEFLAGGVEPGRHGNAHPNLVPYEIYETQDRWLALGLGNEPQWARFCALTGREDLLTDVRFATNVQRTAHRDALNEHLIPIFAAHPLDWWLRELSAAAIPCAAVNTVPQALASPQLRALEFVQEVAHPLHGTLRMARSPLYVEGRPLEIRRPPPCLGQHTREVLEQVLKMEPAAIEALRQQGAIAAA